MNLRKVPHPLLEISQTLEKLSIFERSYYQMDLNKRPKYKIYEQQSTDAIREQSIVAPPQTSKSFHLTPIKKPNRIRLKPPEIKLSMESTSFKVSQKPKVTKSKKSTSTDKRYDDLLIFHTNFMKQGEYSKERQGLTSKLDFSELYQFILNMIQNDEDRPWKDFQGILPDDVWQQFEKIGPTAYPHQFEFINYCLQPNSAPIIGLRSLTGSGKTLCFQALLYANFKKELQYFQMRQLKQKDGSIKDARVLFPYAIVLGQTIYLKQHEENFMKYLPDRLRGENGLTFQTFFAFGKDKGYQIEENKIEEAKANTLLCHPSKLKVAIQQRIFNASNLRYLIIDEADQLLSKDENNQARGDTLRIISFILGQTQNSNFQIIFVSATLKEKEIQELIQECVDNNFKEDKKIDKRFVDDSLGFKEVKFDLKMLPAAFTDQIAPYEITHYYIESNDPQEKTLVEILKQIFEDMQEAQVMIFFNSKVETGKIKNALLADQQMEFIVKQDYIIDCTGDTDQVKREEVRQEFLSGKKRILFCTDVLQRGLDFRKVRAIIHYSLPIDAAQQFKPESYFQRSGRTGRAKDEGVVVSIFSKDDIIKNRKDVLVNTLQQAKSKIQQYNPELFMKDLRKAMKLN